MKQPIIIIGAGLAGLSAAYTCAKEQQAVCLVSALPSEQAQSIMAEGGINGALDTKGEGDSPDQHYADTMHAGCDLAAPNAVWNLTHAAPDLIRHLAALGVPFNRTADGDIDVRYFGGQRKARTAFVQSDTGKQLMTALIDAVRQYEVSGLVQRLPHHAFKTLLLHDRTCCGCIVTDTFTGEDISLTGPVIIATGGLHGLFQKTTGSLINTGAVTAELFRLGVPIANGEFIQFHPTTVQANGKYMLISEAARGEGGRLYTMRGGEKWYFMEEKYPTLGNLMPRDITSREIDAIVRAGQAVYLDVTKLPRRVLTDKLQGLVDDCQTYLGLDIAKDPIPVTPGIHYFMGGIAVDAGHRAAFSYLYAAGECAAQYHGANRLGGNSLLGAIYGGTVAAKTALAERPESVPPSTATPLPPPLATPDWHQLKGIMDDALGITRTAEGLQEGLTKLWDFPASPLVLLGRAMIQSALARHESRGAHYRSDYPQRDDDQFHKTTIATYDGHGISISFQPIPTKQ